MTARIRTDGTLMGTRVKALRRLLRSPQPPVPSRNRNGVQPA